MLPQKALLALLPYFLSISAQSSGSGTTTRYWDCCKASCGWNGKISLASGATPAKSCDKNDNALTDFDAKSGCQSGGTAFMCTNQSPWAVDDTLSYGFAATTIAGGSESSWCCACYELTFTSGPVSGKKLVVQATNTGGDLGSNQFDLAMPGGGFGIFNGCTTEFGTPSGGWGAQYGGVTSRSQCDSFNDKLKAGCYWRFDWFQNADNPAVTFKQVTCPKAITDKSGCVRSGETPTGDGVVPTYTASAGGGGGGSPTSSAGTPVGTPSDGAGAELYAQCGGTGWSGPTTCKSGTCTVSTEYYSQCLP